MRIAAMGRQRNLDIVYTGTAVFDLLLPADSRSLKAKRSYVRPIVAALRKFEVAAAEVGLTGPARAQRDRGGCGRRRRRPTSTEVLDACERLVFGRPEVEVLAARRSCTAMTTDRRRSDPEGSRSRAGALTSIVVAAGEDQASGAQLRHAEVEEMTDPAKVRRHAERVRELVAEAIRTQIKDPRLGMITITDSRITADLREATVFYTVLGDVAEQAATAAALDSAKGLLRSTVGKALGLASTRRR